MRASTTITPVGHPNRGSFLSSGNRTTREPNAAETTQRFRSQIGHISRQSSVFFAGTVFTAVAGYLFKVYLARTLGAEALGIYALGMTVGGVASLVAAPGLPQTASRFVAVYVSQGENRKLSRLLWSGLGILAVANFVLAIAMIAARRWIALQLYHTPALAQYMHFFAAIMLTGALTSFLGQAMAGYKDVSRRTVITSFIGTPATMAFTLLLVSLGLGLRGYLAAQVGSALLVLILLARATWKLTPVPARSPFIASPEGSRFLEPEVVSFAVVLFGIQVLEFIASQTDRILLGIYMNAREVGIYAVAMSLVAFVAIFLQAINQIFAPTIAELHANGERDLLLRLYQTLTKWSLGLAIPLALGLMVFARPLMGIFGADFRAGWPVLAIATVGQLVNCGVGSVGFLLLMSNQQRRMVRAQAIVVGLTLLLNLALIPHWGMIGAAAASVATTACMNLLLLWDVKKKLHLFPSVHGYLCLLVPTAVTVAVLCAVRFLLRPAVSEVWLVLLGFSAGYVVFALAAWRFALEPQDWDLGKTAYGRVRAMF